MAGSTSESTPGSIPWTDGLIRYAIVHSRTVVVLFVDTRPVDAIGFHHDLLGGDDPKMFSRFPGCVGAGCKASTDLGVRWPCSSFL